MAPTTVKSARLLSWLVPCLAGAIVGAFFQIPAIKLGDENLIVVMLGATCVGVLATAITGMASRGAARPFNWLAVAWPGIMTNGLILATLTAGLGGAQISRSAVAQDTAKIRSSASEAQTKMDGWYGDWEGPAGHLMFMEVPPHSDLAKNVSASFSLPFRLFLVGGQATTDGGGISVSLEKTFLVMRDRKLLPALDRGSVLDAAKVGRDAGIAAHGHPYRVAAGGKLANGLLFLPPDLVTKDLTALMVRVNDADVRIQGRMLSAEEKARIFR